MKYKKNISLKGIITFSLFSIMYLFIINVNAEDYQTLLDNELNSINDNYVINVSSDYRTNYKQALHISLSNRYYNSNYNAIVKSCDDTNNTCNISLYYKTSSGVIGTYKSSKIINVSYIEENSLDKETVLDVVNNINENYSFDSRTYSERIIKNDFMHTEFNLENMWKDSIISSINNNLINFSLYEPSVDYGFGNTGSSVYEYTNFFTLEKNGIIYYASHENGTNDKQVFASIEKKIYIPSDTNIDYYIEQAKVRISNLTNINASNISISKEIDDNYKISYNDIDYYYKIEKEENSENNSLVNESQKEGWFTENENTYYYSNDIMLKGIQKIGDYYYFLGENTGKLFRTPVTAMDGTIYYPDNEGRIKTGFIEVGGYTYYYDTNFQMLKGIQKIGEQYYFLGENTGRLFKTKVISNDGTTYYPDSEGRVKTGFIEVDGYTYYYDDNFKMLKGIQKIGDYYYFLGENTGRLFKTRVISNDGTTYYPDSEGRVKTGFIEVDGYTYYYDDNFKMLKGIQKIGEQYYFLGENTGRLFKTPVTTLNGSLYIPDSDGRLTTGWKKNNTYYTELGKAVFGKKTINEKMYFFDKSSYLLTYGWIIDGDDKYYADNNGVVLVGDQVIDKMNYYFNINGILYTGWRVNENNKYYYINGIMQKGFFNIKGKNYFFGEITGKLWIGWVIALDGSKYYSNLEGELQRGIIKVENNYYFLGENTFKLRIGWVTSINGNTYYTNSEGIIQTGLQKIDGEYYFLNENGVLSFGWMEVEGNMYYQYSNGVKAVGIKKIAGKRYLFASDGKLLVSDCKVYIDISSAQVTINNDGNTVNIDVIDWNALWNSGEIDGILLKAGSGSLTSGKTYNKNTDFLKKAIAKCESLGIPYGVYWYSYAEVYNGNDNHETIDEANIFINTIRSYAGNNLKLGIYWDLEENSDKSQNIIMVNKFMEIMHNNGYDAKIYCNKNYAENVLSDFSSYITWIAHYTGDKQADNTYSSIPNRKTGYNGNWNIWQFSDAGFVTGINGYVDLNIVR